MIVVVYKVDKVRLQVQVERSLATAATLERPVEKLRRAEEQVVKNLRSALRQVAGVADPTNLARLAGIAFRQEFPVAKPDNRLANAKALAQAARQCGSAHIQSICKTKLNCRCGYALLNFIFWNAARFTSELQALMYREIVVQAKEVG